MHMLELKMADTEHKFIHLFLFLLCRNFSSISLFDHHKESIIHSFILNLINEQPKMLFLPSMDSQKLWYIKKKKSMLLGLLESDKFHFHY